MNVNAIPLPRSPSPIPPIPLSEDIFLPPSPSSNTPFRSNDIPWSAIIPLMFIRIADAATYVVIFPFITDMITSFNVPQDKIGLYAGMGEGTLMIVEAIVAPFWAKYADKYGRRPTIIWGFLACVIPAAAVGFSSRVWHIILWRALFGLNPIGVLGKIVASEICHPGNRAKVFAIWSPSFSVGGMIGTLLGGVLAHPYGRLPSWLGGTSELWRRWPYGLPCVVVGILGFVATLINYFTLIETRPPGVGDRRNSDLENQEKRPAKATYRAALKVPHFVLISTLFCLFQGTTMSWDSIFTIYTYTAVKNGGLGLPVDNIGLIMSFGSLIFIFTTPIILPTVVTRLGAPGALKKILLLWPLLALTLPLAQLTAANARWLMWIIVGLQQLIKTFGNFAWPLNDMMSMGAFDDYPHLLATGSAISLIAGAFGRAIGPSVSGWIYSISTQYGAGTWGRQTSWMAFLCFALPPVILARFLPHDTGKKAGYESVPLTAQGEDEGESEDDDNVVKVSARQSFEGRHRHPEDSY